MRTWTANSRRDGGQRSSVTLMRTPRRRVKWPITRCSARPAREAISRAEQLSADGCAPNTAVLGSRVYIRMPPSNRPSGDNAEISRGRRHRDEFKIRGRKHAEFLACSFFPAQHPDLRMANGPMQTAIEP
jgi:hypothetical protein